MFKKILALVGLLSLVVVSPVLANTVPVHADLSAGYQYQTTGVGNQANVFSETLYLYGNPFAKTEVFAEVTANQFNRTASLTIPSAIYNTPTWQAGVKYNLSKVFTLNASVGTELQTVLSYPGQARYQNDVAASVTAHLF